MDTVLKVLVAGACVVIITIGGVFAYDQYRVWQANQAAHAREQAIPKLATCDSNVTAYIQKRTPELRSAVATCLNELRDQPYFIKATQRLRDFDAPVDLEQ